MEEKAATHWAHSEQIEFSEQSRHSGTRITWAQEKRSAWPQQWHSVHAEPGEIPGKRGTETGEDDRGRGKKEGIPFEVEKGEEKKKANETKNRRKKNKNNSPQSEARRRSVWMIWNYSLGNKALETKAAICCTYKMNLKHILKVLLKKKLFLWPPHVCACSYHTRIHATLNTHTHTVFSDQQDSSTGEELASQSSILPFALVFWCWWLNLGPHEC